MFWKSIVKILCWVWEVHKSVSCFRLAVLLGTPKDALQGQLAVTAATMDLFPQAVKLANELIKDRKINSEMAEVLYKVALIINKKVDLDVPEEGIDNLPETLHDFAAKATAYCDPGTLSCIDTSC